MHAKMSMPMDTVFGNTMLMEIEAELDAPHEQHNRALFEDMARMLQYMLEEVRNHNDRALRVRQEAR